MNGQSNEERMEVRRKKLFSARIETIWNRTILSKDNEQLQNEKRKFNKISITKLDNRKKCSLEF
jgi:hypothetical protein